MRIEPVEIYSDESNVAVMRHPGRRFPGSLIQGDSLSVLVTEARELYEAVRALADEELLAMAKEHKEKLEGRLAAYGQALKSHDIKLPYIERVQPAVQADRLEKAGPSA